MVKTLTRSDLVRRSAVELSVLHHIFNEVLVAAEPLSPEWRAAADAVDAIHEERDGRLDRPFRFVA